MFDIESKTKRRVFSTSCFRLGPLSISSNMVELQSLQTCFEYDSESLLWREASEANLTVPRQSASGVQISEQTYLVGGERPRTTCKEFDNAMGDDFVSVPV